jgi:hypothetical protein
MMAMVFHTRTALDSKLRQLAFNAGALHGVHGGRQALDLDQMLPIVDEVEG